MGLFARDLDLQAIVSFGSRRPSLVLLMCLVGILVDATRLRWLLPIVTLVMSLLWATVAFTPLSASLAAGLIRRDPPQPVDAIVVCASRLLPEGEPTPEAMSRLVRGLELLGQGQAPRLILPEAPGRPGGYTEMAISLMRNLGLSQEVLTVQATESTREEAVAVSKLCRQRGWSRVIVVTSPLHSLRASASIEQEGLHVVSCPARETRFAVDSLRRSDEPIRAFGSIVHEKIGLWTYERRGWITRRSLEPAPPHGQEQ
jgi:uncharacterized SAM-binding protein YcdF (DUF218 family)